jgi:hypothetical protein
MNHVPFLYGAENENVLGKVIDIPCKNDNIYDNEDGWAVPIQDSGIFTGFDFLLAQGENEAKPSADSIAVFRLRDKNYNEWLVYGSKNDFFHSCATCCGTDGVPMPGISPSFSLRVPPCQTVDIKNTNGNPYMIFGIPTLGAGQAYFPYGIHNNVPLTSASTLGYSSVSTLLAFLNTNWTPYVWTASSDNLTLIATGGTLGDSLCVQVIAVIPSA